MTHSEYMTKLLHNYGFLMHLDGRNLCDKLDYGDPCKSGCVHEPSKDCGCDGCRSSGPSCEHPQSSQSDEDNTLNKLEYCDS